VLLLGNEVNTVWEDHPQAVDAFAAAFPALRDAIREASPSTLVGTVFQYEMLRGAGYLTGEAGSRSPQWELLDRFAGSVDVVAFTTYPYFDHETPGAIPADYYAEAAARAGAPIGFTEVGWPSRPLSVAPESGYGGSPEEQAAFVQRFGELIEGVDVAFALWSFPHDVGSAGGPTFESVSLRENDGTPKPALAAWQELLR
jgi:hypothetical protein